MTLAHIWLLAQTPVQEAQKKTAAEEGADIVLSMLVVGLVFVLVIAIGELTHYLAVKRKERTPSRTL
jgi:heme/copper-type cytochrome/quinol oxidase subunit 2